MLFAKQFFIATGIALLPVIALASSTSANYTITRDVIDSGGGPAASSSHVILSSIGQSGGAAASSNFTIYTGFLSVPDTDGDSILDNVDNCILVVNPTQLDTDLDALGNACDNDDDNDGLSDSIEISLGTDPLLTDSDNDGLSDFAEVNFDGDPTSYQAGVDTDPNNADTDGDGLLDGVDPAPLLASPDGDLAPYGAPDGIVNAADVLIAQRITLGLIIPTDFDLAHGDVYPPGAPDGIINLPDLLLIKKMVLGIP